MTSETGTVALNQQIETGPGGYTILIRPSGAPRVIEGRRSITLISLGADRVTLNGTLHGAKGLTLRNTDKDGGAAIAFLSDADDNSITGCVIESTGQWPTVGAVTVYGIDNPARNTSIIGNTIRGWDPGPAYDGPSLFGPFVLVAVVGATHTIVANNELSRYGGNAIMASNARDVTISGNIISDNDTGQGPGTLQVIWVDHASGNSFISRNVIRDHFTGSFTGIGLLKIETPFTFRAIAFTTLITRTIIATGCLTESVSTEVMCHRRLLRSLIT